MSDATGRAPALLGAAAAAYVVAAWLVAPGFYDGITPPQQYNFVCPPAVPGGDSGVKPGSAHAEVRVIDGVSEASSAYTADGQVFMGFLPGAFDGSGRSHISVDISPVSPCPQPGGIRFVTNTYLVSADAPLTKGASLVMVYSNLELDPSYVYRSSSPDGPWANLGSAQQAQFWTIQPAEPTRELGYFAAGYPSNTVSRSGPGNQLLPAAVAALIAGVLLAGIPLAAYRRRRAARSPNQE